MSDCLPTYDGWLHWIQDPECPGGYRPVWDEDLVAEELQREKEEREDREQLAEFTNKKKPMTIHMKNGRGIMESILITKHLYFATYGEQLKYGFTINFDRQDPEATLFVAAEAGRRKIPSEIVVQFYKDLQQTINLQKVFDESIKRKDADNYSFHICMQNDDTDLDLASWEPDKSDNEAYIKTESYKLIMLIEKFMTDLDINW